MTMCEACLCLCRRPTPTAAAAAAASSIADVRRERIAANAAKLSELGLVGRAAHQHSGVHPAAAALSSAPRPPRPPPPPPIATSALGPLPLPPAPAPPTRPAAATCASLPPRHQHQRSAELREALAAVARATGESICVQDGALRLGDAVFVPSLPFFVHRSAVGCLSLQPLPRIPRTVRAAADEDSDDDEIFTEIRVLRVRGGAFDLVTPRSIREVTPRSWRWRSESARIGALQRLRESEVFVFPPGEDVCDRSEEDDSSSSDDSSMALSDEDSDDSSYHPSDEDSESSQPADDAKEGEWTKGGRRRITNIFAEIVEWIRVPMCFRAFSRLRRYAPSRFKRMKAAFIEQICEPPQEIPIGKRPCVLIRLKSCAMAMRLIASRSREALAAIRDGQAPAKRRCVARRQQPGVVQRGPSWVGLQPPPTAAAAGSAASAASGAGAAASAASGAGAAASAASGAGDAASAASAAGNAASAASGAGDAAVVGESAAACASSTGAAAAAAGASSTGAPAASAPAGVVYHVLYIDTAGGQLAGARVTTAALRKAPPDPPFGSGDKRALAIIGVWLGSFKGRAPIVFSQSLPPCPRHTIHHHDLASFWAITDADPGAACCALDTTRCSAYWSKRPCICVGTLRDIHSMSRTEPLPLRCVRLLHNGLPIDYVYPRGHHLKNTVLSIWGTLCIVVGRYDPDLAAELERQFPRGDGFNPRLVGLTADQLEERTTRKPAADGRCKTVKEFLRQPDDVLFILIDRVRDDVIVNLGSQWTVRRFLKYTVQYCRCLLDPAEGMPWLEIRRLGLNLFRIYKHWLAASFPFTVPCNGPNREKFEVLTEAERRSLVSDIKFNTAETLCGIPVHYTFEHAVEPYIKYPFPVARSLALEEGEENTFLELAEKLPKLTRRRIHRIPFLREVGECTILVAITGWPGDSNERNRRYWSYTDVQIAAEEPG